MGWFGKASKILSQEYSDDYNEPRLRRKALKKFIQKLEKQKNAK